MEIQETGSEGLSKTFKVTVSAKELQARLDKRIAEMQPQVRLKGFRPGKVPVSHIKKMYGKSILSDIVQNTVMETSEKALVERDLRAAAQPDIRLETDMNKVSAGADLSYQMQVDVMPEFKPADPASLELEKLKGEASEAEITEQLQKLADENRSYAPRPKSQKAKEGDLVTIDFLGKIDGEPFEGGAAEDAKLVLGKGGFIPGFEDGIVGAKPGSDIEVKVRFPDDYGAADLAGKDAVFEVKVKEVEAPEDASIDDELAQRFGLDDLEALRNAVKTQIEMGLQSLARQKLKRQLLDKLDAIHDFDLPARMVEAEFQSIWGQVQREGLDEDMSEDEQREEFRKIAERRVRLGLVLAEIGRAAGVVVTDQELGQAIVQQARQYRGQEQAVFDAYKNNPQLQAQLRAPLYEEKVVDHIVSVAKTTERAATREELEAEDDSPFGEAGGGKAEGKKAAAKKPATKKAAAKTDGKAEAKSGDKKAAAKKPAAKKSSAKAKAKDD